MKLKPLKKKYEEAGLTHFNIYGEERDQLVIQTWYAMRSVGFYVTLESLLKNLPQ